ncbi:hypothetical protein HHX47_DHR6000156, partial [Lentinula edodes]
FPLIISKSSLTSFFTTSTVYLYKTNPARPGGSIRILPRTITISLLSALSASYEAQSEPISNFALYRLLKGLYILTPKHLDNRQRLKMPKKCLCNLYSADVHFATTLPFVIAHGAF